MSTLPRTAISEVYAMLLNLSNAAHDHKAHCETNCNVSLGGLARLAEYLLPQAPESERAVLRDMVAKMPRY